MGNGGAAHGAPATSQSGPGPSSPSRRPPGADGGDNDGGDSRREATPRGETPAPAPAKKPKVTISYDKYMTIMQKIVYMLADVERETNQGLPRSEVVQRYLEDIEGEMNSPEQMDIETTLIKKVLTKLVKVSAVTTWGPLNTISRAPFAGEIPS